jgi:sarcosine oxidase subunit delta
MKLMRCPVNGLRPIQEFAYGGLFRPSPDPVRSTDREWADYVFSRSGEPALKKEWWYHIASGTWFIAERNTVTDEIVETYLFDGA